MKKFRLTFLIISISLFASCSMMENLFHDDDDENEQEIKISELPDAVINAIEENYAGAELLEADEITHDDGSISYDVEIKYEGSVIEVMYDASGNFLGVEDDSDDDGEEDDD